jgi:hypothetical protein
MMWEMVLKLSTDEATLVRRSSCECVGKIVTESSESIDSNEAVQAFQSLAKDQQVLEGWLA